jgi:hypothetical protein
LRSCVEENLERPRWMLVLYVALQVLIPTLLLIARWLIFDGACLNFGWQMYACA